VAPVFTPSSGGDKVIAEVAILGEGRWHGRALEDAFARTGLPARHLSFRDLAFTSARAEGLRLGDLARLPRAVLVRAIAAGSFEQITLRLAFLHALEGLGVAVFNPPRAIERCVDKATASFLLHRAGLPTPPFFASEEEAAVRAHVAASGAELVAKPLFGNRGRGLRRVAAAADLPAAAAVAGVWYLQRYIARRGGFCDYRVFVVAGEAIAAMRRRGAHWITNIGQGARPEPVALSPRLAALAVAACEAVGAFFAGVDVIEDEEGALFVLEVNSMPAWSGLQRVSPVAIADRLAAAVAARIRASG